MFGYKVHIYWLKQIILGVDLTGSNWFHSHPTFCGTILDLRVGTAKNFIFVAAVLPLGANAGNIPWLAGCSKGLYYHNMSKSGNLADITTHWII
jgi:hypothetical protein